MAKSPKVSPQQRKGRVVSDVTLNSSQTAKLDQLSATHGGVSEFRQYDNGSVGVFFNDGKFRFVSGSTALVPRAKGSKVTYPKLSPRAAKIAFGKYYRKKQYQSPKTRKAAITRDLCSSNKPVVDDSRFRRSPQNYDYPGLDDGSNCPTGKVTKKRSLSSTQKAALVSRLPKRGGAVKAKPVSLKTAVKLLRQYYAEKYSS